MKRLGLAGRFFSMPTGIFASFGPPEDHTTSLIRATSADVDLEKLCSLDELGDLVIGGQIGVAEGTRRIQEILDQPSRWRSRHILAAFALSSATATRFFNGGWRELLVAGVIGLIVGIAMSEVGRRENTRQISPIIASALASALATLSAWLFAPVLIYTTTLASLIILIPGLTLTTSITELATGNLVSGTARLMGGVLTFLEIGFGVALGGAIGRLLPEMPLEATVPLPEWTVVIALLIAPAGFMVLLRARPRDLLWITLACIFSFGGARLGTILFGPELGALLGAISLGVAANIFARRMNRPAAVVLLPGLILLVPGSIGFGSLSRFIAHDVMSGVAAAFSVVLIGTAIATGLLVANALVRPNRNL